MLENSQNKFNNQHENSGEWKNLINHGEHTIIYKGMEIVVYDGVFTPDSSITNSTAQTLEYLETLELKDKKILDVGCGTGIIGISCLSKGSKEVTFSDVNQRALENTKFNLEKNNLLDKAKIVKSNLFENIHDKYDVIFGNLPIANDVWQPVINEETKTLLIRFLEDIPNFVEQKGRVIINWASFVPVDEIINKIKELGYKYIQTKQSKLGHDWYIIDLHFD